MKSKHQFTLAMVLIIFGIALIIASFVAPPLGYIDPTVLTAYGETLTFVGAIVGIDASKNNRSTDSH